MAVASPGHGGERMLPSTLAGAWSLFPGQPSVDDLLWKSSRSSLRLKAEDLVLSGMLAARRQPGRSQHVNVAAMKEEAPWLPRRAAV